MHAYIYMHPKKSTYTTRGRVNSSQSSKSCRGVTPNVGPCTQNTRMYHNCAMPPLPPHGRHDFPSPSFPLPCDPSACASPACRTGVHQSVPSVRLPLSRSTVGVKYSTDTHPHARAVAGHFQVGGCSWVPQVSIRPLNGKHLGGALVTLS